MWLSLFAPASEPQHDWVGENYPGVSIGAPNDPGLAATQTLSLRALCELCASCVKNLAGFNCIVPDKSLSENPGARLCRPRPAAASPNISVPWSVLAVLRLVFDTAALLFQTGTNFSRIQMERTRVRCHGVNLT